jgi:NADPH-dependent 2,4-dienoyl-CoA reductase/sulfur reductase-like enzyme
MTRLVVVGGNAAGLSAASKAKRRSPSLEVEVLEAGHDISYSSCGIPYLVEGLVEDAGQLLVLSPKDAAERGIQVRTGSRVVAFNPYTKEVVFEQGGRRDSVHYDKLLLATGAAPRNPFPGGDLDGVFAIRHLGDGLRLMERMQQGDPEAVAVVGGGYVGLEMAAAFQARASEVHLLQRGPRLLSSMDADITDGLNDWVAEAGIHVHLNAEVKRFTEGKTAGQLARVEAKKPLDADLAIVAVGVQPATEFAVKAGVLATKEGHILVDDQMRTNFHDVWAAGDCVAARHLLTGRPASVPLALPSNRMGRVAGDSIAASTESIPGASLYFPGVIGTAIARVFGLAFAQTGLTEQACKAEGIDCVTALIESKSRAAYMPDAADMAVKVVAEHGSGKLLGAQVVGPEEAGLRINAAAVAIQAGMKVGKLAEVETAYAPPFGPVWDPLIVAAEQCAKEIRR